MTTKGYTIEAIYEERTITVHGSTKKVAENRLIKARNAHGLGAPFCYRITTPRGIVKEVTTLF